MKNLHCNVVERVLDWMEGQNLNSGHSPFTDQHFGFDCGIQPLWEVSSSANGRGCQGCGVGLEELPGILSVCLWCWVSLQLRWMVTWELFLCIDSSYIPGCQVPPCLTPPCSILWGGRFLINRVHQKAEEPPAGEVPKVSLSTSRATTSRRGPLWTSTCCQSLPAPALPFGPEDQAGHGQMRGLLGIEE